ncbi:MAG: hypothetical protein WDN02_10840 [Methylovirgula sp.]|uniref:hypothetical protein n=1 Tax=Methylovirgula sp. TaxID=1978224 RepID=UPI00307657DF
MAEDKRKRKAPLKTARNAAVKKRAPAKKKPALKKSVAKKVVAKKSVAKSSAAKSSAAKSSVAKKIPARKSVPIKKARVSKRAFLPPLPPPASARKAPRSPARSPSRAKALGRTKTGGHKAVHEIPTCTEAVLRQKLRLAAPYIELWLVQKDGARVEEGTTPEAAFVRIWQWLMLAAALEGSHVVITPDLVQKLFAEEMGRAPTA